MKISQIKTEGSNGADARLFNHGSEGPRAPSGRRQRVEPFVTEELARFRMANERNSNVSCNTTSEIPTIFSISIEVSAVEEVLDI